MCFSAEADIALGVVVGAVGIDALRHVTRPAQWPIASLPVLFAAHQLNEVFVWWGLDGPFSSTTADVAAWIYLFVAFVLPVIVPVAVALVEPDRVRRNVMVSLLVPGGLASVVLVGALIRNGADARIAEFSIVYGVGIDRAVELTGLYVLATCGAFLVSTDRRMVAVGAVNLVAVGLLAWLLVDGLVSLWCAWAAVVSVLIAGYLRSVPTDRPRRAPSVTRSGT